jgi:uncharacterized LabA/DUF88 family protein
LSPCRTSSAYEVRTTLQIFPDRAYTFSIEAPASASAGAAFQPQGARQGSLYYFCGMARARVFIDYWNFQLSWNQSTNRAACDWRALPAALVNACHATLKTVGFDESLSLEETIVHASVEVGDGKQRAWFTNFLDRQPSYDVKIRDRRPRPRKMYCKKCSTETSACPACGEPFRGAAEKGVDTALVTDLLSLAWQAAYDVAILVTSDADFIPAVEHVQAKGLKVVNAAWPGLGFELKAACWANFDMRTIASSLYRKT